MRQDVIDALWARFEEDTNDIGLLAIISDAYRDIGSEQYADCLLYCAKGSRIPDGSTFLKYAWYSFDKDGRNFEVWSSINSYYLDPIWGEIFDCRWIVAHDQGKTRDAYFILCDKWDVFTQKKGWNNEY